MKIIILYSKLSFFEGVAVHCISNGVVKKISHDLSWGTRVAIESCLPNNDTITIIYGHLSRFLSVTVGELLYIGQKK